MGYAIMIPNVSFASAGLGTVTPVTNVPLTALLISGDDTINVSGNTATFTAIYTPNNTTQKGVTWSIEDGSDYASIDATTGVLSVKSGADASSVTIKVTSTEDATISATKVISVTYNSVITPIYSETKTLTSGQTPISTGIKPFASDSIYTLVFKVSSDYEQNKDKVFMAAAYINGSSNYGMILGYDSAFEKKIGLWIRPYGGTSFYDAKNYYEDADGNIIIVVIVNNGNVKIYTTPTTYVENAYSDDTELTFGASTGGLTTGSISSGTINVYDSDLSDQITSLFN